MPRAGDMDLSMDGEPETAEDNTSNNEGGQGKGGNTQREPQARTDTKPARDDDEGEPKKKTARISQIPASCLQLGDEEKPPSDAESEDESEES